MNELDAELLREIENTFIAVELSESNSNEPGIGDELEAPEAR
jgi:hypothetical protein